MRTFFGLLIASFATIGSAQATTITIDPNAYAPGTNLSNIYPWVTLSVARGYVDFVDYDPTPTLVEPIHLTGPDLGPIIAQGTYMATASYPNWASDPQFARFEVFKAAFSVPVNFVSMTFIPDDTDNGVFGVYDQFDNLMSHQFLRTSGTFTLSYDSGSASIAYILAGFHDPGYLGAITFEISQVPEPQTYALFLTGLGLLAFLARRQTKVSHTSTSCE